MSDVQTPATELMSQYTAQVTSDLERNTKEQERIAADIEALQEQLRALQGDHSVLVNMQQALGNALPATAAAQGVPHQAAPTSRQNKPKKAAAGGRKKAASKKTAAKASSAKTTTATKPSLVDLIHSHLEQHSEPRSAAEITTALAQAHPDRNIKATVVRTTLENLVAKSRAHRAKQGSSVYYTPASAAAGPQQKTAATAG